jgi:outer membrane protein assembly factor BamB
MLKWVGLAILVLLAVAVYRLLGGVIGAKVEQQVAKVGLTPNQVAAHGPLPGDVSLYAKELACQQKIPTPGYYPSLNGAEISDSERSGVFPCATFLGSMDGPNQVYAWRSADDYPGIAYINNRKPGELYIIGGEVPTAADPIPAGPYLAKADATTGEQIWRTYFDNANASGWYIGNTNLNLLDNGSLALSWSNNAVLVDGDTGQILKISALPSGIAPPAASNFKHLTIAPDRTLIYKNQTRPAECKGQGTLGIIKCIQDGMKLPNSVLVAVNPDTLEVLGMLQLPEPAPAPHIVTKFHDRIAVYVGMTESVRRYFWDPAAKKLSADDSWVVFPIQKGQTTATAPSVIGDWIVVQLNGAGSKEVASSIAAIHRDDAKKTKVIFPFGPLKPGGFSFAPPKAGADPENGMVYSADMGMGKVAGIKLDQATGDMKVAFVVDDVTSTFQPVIGPKDKRVLLLTNARLNVEKEPLMAAIFTNNYKEQLTWRDAATGKLLAESDFFEPLTINSLTPPGFGGRIYFPTAAGKGFYVLQVMPKPVQAPGK